MGAAEEPSGCAGEGRDGEGAADGDERRADGIPCGHDLCGAWKQYGGDNSPEASAGYQSSLTCHFCGPVGEYARLSRCAYSSCDCCAGRKCRCGSTLTGGFNFAASRCCCWRWLRCTLATPIRWA